MKLSWPFGITMIMLLFMGGTLYMVFTAVQQDYSLVSEQYYEESLDYDLVKNRIDNRLRDETDVEFIYDSTRYEISLLFSESNHPIVGVLKFYNPLYAKKDFQIELKNEGKQVIDLTQLDHGKWKLTATWTQNKTEYQQDFILQKK